MERLQEENERLREQVHDLETDTSTAPTDSDEIVAAGGNDIEFGYTTIDDGNGPEAERSDITTATECEPESLFEGDWIDPQLERAADQSQCTVATARRALVVLAENGPLESVAVADGVGRSTVAVQGLLSELRTEGLLDRPAERTYTLGEDVRSKLNAMAEAE